MKTFTVAFVALAMSCSSQCLYGQLGQAVGRVLKAVAPAARPAAIAAAGAAGATVAWAAFSKNSAYSGENAIYCVNFETTKGQGMLGYFFGARWFGRPDVFLVIEIEGVGRYVVPHVTKNYTGEPIMETLLLREIPEGRKVYIKVYDDRSTSDQFWRDFLSQQVEYSGGLAVDGGVRVSTVRIPLKLDGEFMVHADAKLRGRFQFVQPTLEIVRPTFICYAEFMTPKRQTFAAEGGKTAGLFSSAPKPSVQPWSSKAIFWDQDKTVGHISLSLMQVRG